MSTALSTTSIPPSHSSLAALRTMLCNSVVSPHTRRAYAKAFDEIVASGPAVRIGSLNSHGAQPQRR
jgi:hypothetical protein